MFFGLLLLISDLLAFRAPDYNPFPDRRQRPFPGHVVYDAEGVDDKKINLDEIAKIAAQTQQIIQILKSDDEDFENGLGKKLKKLCKKISHGISHALPKVTEIAGKVAQVGQVLGYDAEDIDDSLTVATVCAIIGAVCAVTNTGLTIYDHVKGDDVAELLEFAADDAENKKINLDEIAKIAGQTQQIIQILKSDDEDFENGLGKKLKKLGKKISHGISHALPKVTEIAGKVSQIGQVLGYETEELDNKFPWNFPAHTIYDAEEAENSSLGQYLHGHSVDYNKSSHGKSSDGDNSSLFVSKKSKAGPKNKNGHKKSEKTEEVEKMRHHRHRRHMNTKKYQPVSFRLSQGRGGGHADM